MTQLKIVWLVPAVLLALVMSGGAFAQSSASYVIQRYSVSAGGGAASSAGYVVKGTLGQSAAGYCASASYRQWVGFWVPDEAAATPIGTIDEAKTLPNGAAISISGKAATSSAVDFAGFLYIEESDRSSGIRVSPNAMPGGLQRGSIVDVVGTMSTTGVGERQIANASVTLTNDPLNPLTPVGMNNKAVGGGDFGDPVGGAGQYGVADAGTGTNNVGLLIKTWGAVTEKGTDYLLVGDGSGVTMRVDTTGMTGLLPDVNDNVSLTGLSSLYTGHVRLVLPRDRGDIVP